jgi:hypothetical protein
MGSLGATPLVAPGLPACPHPQHLRLNRAILPSSLCPLPLCSHGGGIDSVAFTSSAGTGVEGAKDGSGLSAFWEAERAWQQETLASAFAVTVRAADALGPTGQPRLGAVLVYSAWWHGVLPAATEAAQSQLFSSAAGFAIWRCMHFATLH